MDNFEESLMQKYPDLFYKNKSGELECLCGVWVPQGWEGIVDDLCGSITQHTKCTYRTSIQVTSNMHYFWDAFVTSLDWIHRKFLKVFPEYNKWEYNKLVFAFIEKFRKRSRKHVKYIKVYPAAVKINQIKEKFGDLRFYYTGGDDEVKGMVQFAEYLCCKTCEVTGNAGTLCVRGGWYKTLSPELLKEDAYRGYKPANNS